MNKIRTFVTHENHKTRDLELVRFWRAEVSNGGFICRIKGSENELKRDAEKLGLFVDVYTNGLVVISDVSSPFIRTF